MVGVMARHLDAYASESSTVGFPSKEVVALRGDPSPLPPHLPRPPPSEPSPHALAEVPGHIDEVHGVHLFGDRLFAFCARGTKVEVEIANQEWTCTRGACLPGSFDIIQRLQVGGGDVTPRDKKSGVVHL
jgi:hypothetical protein